MNNIASFIKSHNTHTFLIYDYEILRQCDVGILNHIFQYKDLAMPRSKLDADCKKIIMHEVVNYLMSMTCGKFSRNVVYVSGFMSKYNGELYEFFDKDELAGVFNCIMGKIGKLRMFYTMNIDMERSDDYGYLKELYSLYTSSRVRSRGTRNFKRIKAFMNANGLLHHSNLFNSGNNLKYIV